MVFNRYSLYSFLVHGVLVALVFAVAIKKNNIDLENDKVTIEILNQASQSSHEVKKVGKLKAASSNKLAKLDAKDQASRLFPKLDLLSKVEQQNAEFGSTTKGATAALAYNQPQAYYSDISEVFGDNQKWNLYKEIFTKIDSELVFDSLLAQYNHFGKVYVEFKISKQGLLLEDQFKADAIDPILKVHVLRAIKKSFGLGISLKNSDKLTENLLVQAQFNFAFGLSSLNYEKQAHFGRPIFVFKRYTEEEPIPEEILQHLMSGAVTPNISLMIERWQKFNKKNRLKANSFDPFSSYRKDPFYNL